MSKLVSTIWNARLTRHSNFLSGLMSIRSLEPVEYPQNVKDIKVIELTPHVSKCVNMHDELVDALRSLYNDFLSEEGMTNDEIVAGDTSSIGDAKAALAKVEK